MGSVAVADVPDSPLSTVHVLVMHGSTASTLPPLLLNALHGDTCQHGVGSVDAVAVESDFVHGSSIRGQGAMPRLGGTDARLSQHRSAHQRRPSPMRWGRRWSSSRSSYLPPGTLLARRMRYDRHLRWWVCSLHPAHRTYPRQQVGQRTCSALCD